MKTTSRTRASFLAIFAFLFFVGCNQSSRSSSESEEGESEETHEVGKTGAGPHQGIIEEAGEENHMEMVLNGSDAEFYPLDELTNPMDIKGWSGKAVFQYADSTSKNFDLEIMDDMLMATGANAGQKFKAEVTLSRKGKSISAAFESEVNDGSTAGSNSY